MKNRNTISILNSSPQGLRQLTCGKISTVQTSNSMFDLSLLEVEGSDGINKDKEKEQYPTKMCSSNCSKEVIFISQKLFKVNIHWKISTLRDMDKVCYITKLRCNEAIYSPCNWRTPVIPSPPGWNCLQITLVSQKVR